MGALIKRIIPRSGYRLSSNLSTVTMPGNSAGRGDLSYKEAQWSSILRPGTNFESDAE